MRPGDERLSGFPNGSVGPHPAEASQSPIRSCRMQFFGRLGAMPAQETIGAVLALMRLPGLP